MSKMTIGSLSRLMAKMDVATLTTRNSSGALVTRPMSNNGRVEYDGDSFYFTKESASSVTAIESDPHVALSFQGKDGKDARNSLYVSVEGIAQVIRSQIAFVDRWSPGLIRWFPDGVRTSGMVMIHVRAERIRYWHGDETGEIIL